MKRPCCTFFSTWSNKRTDNYGGDFAGRARFLLETLAAVRDVWPEHLPLAARFGVTEFDGSDDLEEGIEMVRRLEGNLVPCQFGRNGFSSDGPAFRNFLIMTTCRLELSPSQ